MKSQVFYDFDAFAESVRDVESKMLLRNPKRRVWTASSVDVGPIDVQLARLGSGNIAQGQLRSDGFMLYMPLTKATEYKANGAILEKGSFAILEPGCEFCVTTKVEHDWCGAFIPNKLLDDKTNHSSFASKLCRATRPNVNASIKFREAVFEILNAAKSPFFEKSPAAQNASQELLKITNAILEQNKPANGNPEGRPKASREEIIRKSMELIEEKSGGIINVGELAAAAAVSERTLRTAFNEHFGASPIRYLQLRNLHLIRRRLKSADHNEVSVRQILSEHGEWAFGRFASRYHQLFGELPSETLRSKS